VNVVRGRLKASVGLGGGDAGGREEEVEVVEVLVLYHGGRWEERAIEHSCSNVEVLRPPLPRLFERRAIASPLNRRLKCRSKHH
jgi:hypothetical protein